jgi:ankyrin repeat protein
MIDAVDITRLLLLYGARIGLQDHFGQTALVIAVSRDAMNVAKLLIDHGAMEDEEDQGYNVLQAAFLRAASPIEPITPDQESAHRKSVAQRLSFLLEHGASASSKSNGDTVLGHAITSGHIESVTLLLDHGADPRKKCSYRGEPLLVSIKDNHLDIAHLLIEHKVSVMEDHVEAAIRNQADSSFLGMLIKKCVDSQPPSFGSDALAVAIDYNNMEVVQMLIERNADVNVRYPWPDEYAIVRAARSGHTEITNCLISHGANLDLPIGNLTVGHQAMHKAASQGHSDIIKMLLSHGVSINNRPEFEGGHTVLCQAARDGHLKCVQVLLQNGMGLEARCGDGDTVLMSAARACHVEVMQYLLSVGANVNAQWEGHTPVCLPLHWHDKAHDTVQLLLRAGAERCRSCAAVRTRQESPASPVYGTRFMGLMEF